MNKATLLILFIPLLLVPVVHADTTTYTIPVEGYAWTWTKTINVQTQLSRTWTYELVQQSLKIWNDAQNLFQSTYYPTHHSIFQLQATNSTTSQVKVTFTTSTISGESDITGLTHCKYSDAEATFCSIVIRLGLRTNLMAAVVLHEMGHVLGLGHAPYAGDLMYPSLEIEAPQIRAPIVESPSTLDLYALYRLRHGMNPFGSVTSPSNIPYMNLDKGVPLPELPSSWSLLIAVFLTSLIILLQRRQRRREGVNHS